MQTQVNNDHQSFCSILGSLPVIMAGDIKNSRGGKALIKREQITAWTQNNPPKTSLARSSVVKGKVAIVRKTRLEVLRKKLAGEFLTKDGEVEWLININGLGQLKIAIKSSVVQPILFYSFFVGANHEYFTYESSKLAGRSIQSIIQAIASGRKVAYKNLRLFISAAQQGKIALCENVKELGDQK